MDEHQGMIERVADAIEYYCGSKFKHIAAKVAIAAMREPTEEMLYVAKFELLNINKWQAMIDEVLKDGRE